MIERTGKKIWVIAIIVKTFDDFATQLHFKLERSPSSGSPKSRLVATAISSPVFISFPIDFPAWLHPFLWFAFLGLQYISCIDSTTILLVSIIGVSESLELKEIIGSAIRTTK